VGFLRLKMRDVGLLFYSIRRGIASRVDLWYCWNRFHIGKDFITAIDSGRVALLRSLFATYNSKSDSKYLNFCLSIFELLTQIDSDLTHKLTQIPGSVLLNFNIKFNKIKSEKFKPYLGSYL